MHRAICIAAVAASLSAGPALAEEFTTIEGRRIIDAAGAGDIFTDASQGELPKARHNASGLVCSFQPAGLTNKILVIPSGLPRGDDVACVTDIAGGWQTLYATRHAAPVTEAQALSATVGEVGRTVSNMTARPAGGEAARIGNIRPVVARYDGWVRGVPVFTRIAVAKVRGWTIVQWATATTDKAQEAEVRGEAGFTAILLALSARR